MDQTDQCIVEDVLEDVSSANFDGLTISNRAMQKGNNLLAQRPLKPLHELCYSRNLSELKVATPVSKELILYEERKRQSIIMENKRDEKFRDEIKKQIARSSLLAQREDPKYWTSQMDVPTADTV